MAPKKSRSAPCAVLLAMLFAAVPAASQTVPADDLDVERAAMRPSVERWVADRDALERRWRVPMSERYRERMAAFHRGWLAHVESLDLGDAAVDARADAVLLHAGIERALRDLDFDAARDTECAALLPFAGVIVGLAEERADAAPVAPRAAADALAELAREVGELAEIEARGEVARPIARRAAARLAELQRALRGWFEFRDGYDPAFSWWVEEPYARAKKALEEYERFVRREFVGEKDGDDAPPVGDPIGREALVDALAAEFIAYAPEELIAIGERELAWCREELQRAADELGLDGDWRRALEHVKQLHVEPGEQPRLIRELADEAVEFVESRDLLTIPPLATEVWRMQMMSPERQRVTPYFTGGEVVSVSFPTDDMAHADKVMSLRGNNVHFSRAVVHHELIPGHHLQQFMNARYREYRRAFRTPFWIEGWALYWELRLWDLDFPRGPEDRVGMLFWRSHRCARIVFSLRFHLGEMTADEAVDYLVENVGHERRNATAEVRRSVNGDYPPLYQAAYMLGGLQLRALREELVGGGRMSDREFHDAVLRHGPIPIEVLRAELRGDVELTPGYRASWRFAD